MDRIAAKAEAEAKAAEAAAAAAAIKSGDPHSAETLSQLPIDEDRLTAFNEALVGLAGQYRDVVRVQRTAPGQWLIEAIETMH
jgi:hypothetical protein